MRTMRKQTFIFLALASLMTAQSAQATVTLAYANPADNSTVKALTRISTEWEDDDYNWLDLDDVSAVVKDSQGEQVAIGRFSMNWDEYNTFDITITPSVTSPGDYTVEIPGNIFYDVPNEPATLHYTVSDLGGDDVTFKSANPASGSEVLSISSIDLIWDTSIDISYDGAKPTLVDESGNTVATAKRVSQDWNFNGRFTVVFDPEITTAGNYEVVIPANCFRDLDYWERVTSSEVRLSYTILGSEAPTTLDFNRAYPANNSEVTSLSDIKLYWNVGTHGFTVREGAYAGVTDPAGEITRCPMIAGEDKDQFIIVIDPEMTEAGEYTITLADDIFLNAEGVNVVNETVTLKYMVKPVVVKDPEVATFLSSDPSDNSQVMSLSKIVTVWESTAKENAVRYDSEVTVTDENGMSVTSGILSVDEEAENLTIIITLNREITEKGTYTITIPSDFLVDEAGDTVESAEIEINVTVGNPTSVSEVFQADDDVEYYTIDGRKLNLAPTKGLIIVKTPSGSYVKIM